MLEFDFLWGRVFLVYVNVKKKFKVFIEDWMLIVIRYYHLDENRGIDGNPQIDRPLQEISIIRLPSIYYLIFCSGLT
jgi:hypothetical protein